MTIWELIFFVLLCVVVGAIVGFLEDWWRNRRRGR